MRDKDRYQKKSYSWNRDRARKADLCLDADWEDVPQENILAALKDAMGDGFVAWIDVRAMYDRIMRSDR